MPRLTEEQKTGIIKDLMDGKLSDKDLLSKYNISYPALRKYKGGPLKYRNQNQLKEVKQSFHHTTDERGAFLDELRDTFVKLKSQIEAMEKAKNADGSISAGALNTILKTMMDVSKELDRHWTAIEKAEGLYADTLIDNRSVVINQDMIGMVLVEFLRSKGLLDEAYQYIREHEK